MSQAVRTLVALLAVLCCLPTAVLVGGPPAQAAGSDAADADAVAGPREAGREQAHRRRAGRERLTSRPPGRQRLRGRAPRAPRRPALRIETLTPARLIPGRPVRISGTVLNRSDDVWGDAQVGMMAAGSPLTSREQVAAATRADPYQGYAGDRILSLGTFDDIGDIAPGQSRSFAITVPYADLGLSGENGVYWVGVELRVTDDEGLRGPVARTLTFMPLLSGAAQQPTVDLAVLWPVLAPVPWNGEQFVDSSLSSQFSEGGRLRAIVELGATSGREPVTWVLGPAVLDAAREMSRGFTVNGREEPADSEPATAARRWLAVVRSALGGSVALAVPYGNPDVSALVHEGIRPGLRRAQLAADRVLDDLGIARRSLLWPPGGRVDRKVLVAALEQLQSDAVLLSGETFAEPPAEPVVGVRTARSGTLERRGEERTRPTLVVDREQSRLGLRAQPGQSTLQWRQLILSSTALLAASGEAGQEAVAMPSSHWWPDDEWDEANLFESLEVPWVNRVSATALLGRRHATYRGGYRYPPAARRRELGPALLAQLQEVRRTSRTVNHVLADPEGNRARTDKAFGLASSSAWRSDPETGLRIATDFVQDNRDMIRSIDLETPDFVTLSSDSGRFPISVTNHLDQPVTVDLRVRPGNPRVSVGRVAPVTLQRDQRVTVSVPARARGVGITTMTARMRTSQGRAFGPVARFQVRTTQLGVVVWVVMAVGGAVLFLAAGRRIVSRVRAHRRSTGRAR